ncbi:GTPase [Alcanivorax sp.]|uniref:GTPase n=1 Tax=Alcanivorax sp. TaxID=1872427 RepID=UPI0025C06BAA|nr:GTPase [Alcanivorax sp.]
MNSNNQLRKSVEGFALSFNAIADSESELLGIRDRFVGALKEKTAFKLGLEKRNPLMAAGKAVEKELAEAVAKWAEDWDACKTTRELSEQFSDKAILLVFGKVNAGKSSLCNYVASQFKNKDVRFFYLDEGEIRYTEESFKEGVTETTARIQGVELGGKLVLLDSPGLHSVTDENGELTRRFTDSADAVLWLTPSTSPGQVQELDDLRIELESGKPLLPVITRSDIREEDCDEEGNLISFLVNKTPENRREQEDDVKSRAVQKLGSQTEVRKPLSISVHAYKSLGESDESLVESGLAELDAQMACLVSQSSEYKPRKARQQIVNYLDRSVGESVKSTLLPRIDELDRLIADESQALTRRRLEALTRLQHELAESVTDWAEELKERKDRALLAARINSLVTEILAAELRNSVEHFVGKADAILVQIDESDIGDFKDVEISYARVTGRAMQAAASGAGAVVGGLVGSLLGPVGTVVGGAVGAALGGAGGEYLVETRMVSEKVGVDASAAVEDTLKKIDGKLPGIVDRTFSPWNEALELMAKSAAGIRTEIAVFENSLDNIKEGIGHE